jgi:hypothetical protein
MADADRRSALLSAAYVYSGHPLEAGQYDVVTKQPRILALAQRFEDWLKKVDDGEVRKGWEADGYAPL